MGIDVRELKEFQKRLKKLRENELDGFFKECARGLAARLLELVIPLTPVGDYETSTGKQGGTLRRGWTADTEQSAMSNPGTPTDSEQKAYIESCSVTKDGDSYYIDVTNPVFYASYVEYGHRTRNAQQIENIAAKDMEKYWVGGKFMLKMSEQQLISVTPAILESLLEKKLKEAIE